MMPTKASALIRICITSFYRSLQSELEPEAQPAWSYSAEQNPATHLPLPPHSQPKAVRLPPVVAALPSSASFQLRSYQHAEIPAQLSRASFRAAVVPIANPPAVPS